MVCRSGEVVDTLHKIKIDFCCAKETSGSVRMLCAVGRRYKLFWYGCNKGTAGVGVFIAERWIDSVVNVVRVDERIMHVKLVIGKPKVNIVSAYAPQVGFSAEEKDDFWDSFIIVHTGIHGSMVFDTINAEGIMILEFGDAVGMAVCNTFFKRED